MILFGTGCMAQEGRSTSNSAAPATAQTTPIASTAPVASPAISPAISPVTSPVMARSGAFVNAEHETLGGARIITENGSRFIEFDQAFKTDSGPDLFVILTRQNQPPNRGIREQDYISLGMLQSTSGSQRYAIPADLNLAEFASVTIWCRQFNSNFGYAQLLPRT
ncbi:MAG: DM13 domain-containing protein [Coleofasciculaceae cyanobacterium SM2_1_6]|nr:DM13 domain-containing protein [Coleofasciculaceae cyanobacterium SM2_1_6]